MVSYCKAHILAYKLDQGAWEKNGTNLNNDLYQFRIKLIFKFIKQ